MGYSPRVTESDTTERLTHFSPDCLVFGRRKHLVRQYYIWSGLELTEDLRCVHTHILVTRGHGIFNVSNNI